MLPWLKPFPMSEVQKILGAIAACIVLFAETSLAAEKPLTPKERLVCSSLRACTDIISRHDADSFDYRVLQTEFQRFGPKGRSALFDVLESDAGNPDIAHMIMAMRPLNLEERNRLNRAWSLQSAKKFMPLLLDGHPVSRDKLLEALGHKDPLIREMARVGVMKLPASSQHQALSPRTRDLLLKALSRDRIGAAAPYVAPMSVGGDMDLFAKLLLSGNADLVSAAYGVLYRDSPAKAFNILLAKMKEATSAHEARAIGEMLKSREIARADGFYLKFASDISGDPKVPVSARAAGLHAVMVGKKSTFPPLTVERKAALDFLVRGESRKALSHYVPYLDNSGADSALTLIWDIAHSERWINRDKLARSFLGKPNENKIVRDLILSNDVRSVVAGLKLAKPIHSQNIKSQINHPIQSVSDAAHKALKMRRRNNKTAPTCNILPFDLDDMAAQMPFFDSAWIETTSKSRVAANRKALATAHPMQRGWLAGYDLDLMGKNMPYSGGGLMFFDNKTGDFVEVGNFDAPLAVLPDRRLGLGMTTNKFWVVDRRDEPSESLSLYQLEMSSKANKIRHVGAIPKSSKDFSVSPSGDFLITFEGRDNESPPVRISPAGEFSSACSPTGSPSRMSLN